MAHARRDACGRAGALHLLVHDARAHALSWRRNASRVGGPHRRCNPPGSGAARARHRRARRPSQCQPRFAAAMPRYAAVGLLAARAASMHAQRNRDRKRTRARLARQRRAAHRRLILTAISRRWTDQMRVPISPTDPALSRTDPTEAVAAGFATAWVFLLAALPNSGRQWPSM